MNFLSLKSSSKSLGEKSSHLGEEGLGVKEKKKGEKDRVRGVTDKVCMFICVLDICVNVCKYMHTYILTDVCIYSYFLVVIYFVRMITIFLIIYYFIYYVRTPRTPRGGNGPLPSLLRQPLLVVQLFYSIVPVGVRSGRLGDRKGCTYGTYGWETYRWMSVSLVFYLMLRTTDP